MAEATKAFHNRIVLTFDFDRTLGADCTDAVIASLDADPDQVRDADIKPLHSSWDDNLARLFGILQVARRKNIRLTKEHLQRVGRELMLYPEVESMPSRLTAIATEIVEDIDMEFRILSGGFVDVINATSIAADYKAIYGYQLNFDEQGAATFPRRVITHPEKIRYLIAIAKGLDKESGAAPRDVYRDVDDGDMHVPFDQMIYVGDGASDLPAFEFINNGGGIALGVLEPGKDSEQWKELERVRGGQRVQNIAEADYSDGSELFQSLMLAVRSIANRIALRKLSDGK